jgi:DMSO/TMAO reductase YedYZ molybdopterin-dependent catalytic subunit
MRYQDPPGSQDPVQDPRRRPPGGQAARYDGSHQRRPDNQGRPDNQDRRQDWPRDRGRASGEDGPEGGFWNPWTQSHDRYVDTGQATVADRQYPDRQYPDRQYPDRQYPERHWNGDLNTGRPLVAQERPPAGPRRPDRGGGGRGLPSRRGRSRGLLAGAVTGVLAAGTALGVAMLVSAFIRPQASPVIAVGGQVINLTPTPVKVFAVARFGAYDKTMLLGGMYVVIALLAMVVGVLARRKLLVGVIGIGAFGALGAFVAIIQPGSRTTDAIPALIGGVAGVAVIIALVNWPAPDSLAMADDWDTDHEFSPAAGPGRIDRRKFLVAGSATAAVAAGSAVGGQILTNQRFNANASRAAVKLTAPAKKAPALAKQADFNIPGLSPFYTPNASFYRVDTALVVPQVTTQQWSLRVHGMAGRELTLSFNDLLHMPMVERDITIMCVSDAVQGSYIGNARWQGVLLSDVLRQARVQSGVSMLATTDVNGMTIGVPSEIALDGRDTMLAVGMNGVPLPQEHGFPVRLIVPGLYGFCSATKWITDMELTTMGAFTPYWVHRGWTLNSPVKTESRIDTPRTGSSLQAGKVMIAGVAWAQHKGVEQVEVAIDGGAWTKATLAAQDTIDTWRQWFVPWQATAGQHTLQVRATDRTGYTQTPAKRGVYPNGATGYPTVQVTVA